MDFNIESILLLVFSNDRFGINEKKNSTNDNISMKDIYNFLIPVPPIEEQERIVKTIKLAFNEIKG